MAEYFQDQLKPSLADELHDAFEHDPSIEYANTPLWREVIWPSEWLRLRASGVYYGFGVPRGESQPVMLVPGFMSGDILMLEMQRWLRRIGYDAYLSGIVWNTDCPDQTARQLIARIKAIHERTDVPSNWAVCRGVAPTLTFSRSGIFCSLARCTTLSYRF